MPARGAARAGRPSPTTAAGSVSARGCSCRGVRRAPSPACSASGVLRRAPSPGPCPACVPAPTRSDSIRTAPIPPGPTSLSPPPTPPHPPYTAAPTPFPPPRHSRPFGARVRRAPSHACPESCVLRAMRAPSHACPESCVLRVMRAPSHACSESCVPRDQRPACARAGAGFLALRTGARVRRAPSHAGGAPRPETTRDRAGHRSRSSPSPETGAPSVTAGPSPFTQAGVPKDSFTEAPKVAANSRGLRGRHGRLPPSAPRPCSAGST